MKPTIISFTMFTVGVVIGFLLAPFLFEWLAAAFGAPLLYTGPWERLISRFQFGLGCGVLIAAAPVTSIWLVRRSRPVLWTFAYLLLGCVVSSIAALSFHAVYSWGAADLQRLNPMSKAVLVTALPTARLPLIGASAIVCFGLVQRFLFRPRESYTR